MKIKKWRNCKKTKLINLFSLGKMSYTGKFPKQKSANIKKTNVSLVMCSNCSLVQLNRDYNLKYLYGPDYGYRTGMNKTMKEHVKSVVINAKKLTKFKKSDAVLDIASNDGTLLKNYMIIKMKSN